VTEGVPPKLTIVGLAWNETEHLSGCFASLQPLIRLTGAETLVIFDSAGDDATLSVAREVADRVVVADFDNFARQRNRALDAARSKWVFFIDADERCTPRLAQEIARAIDNQEYAAYQVPRRNILFGHEVRHTGWSPDYQLRLLERERCRYDESRLVHELPTVQGEIGTLQATLVHYNYDTWGQFISKQSAYSDLEAQTLYTAGRRASVKSLIGQPLRVLKRRFIDYQGYRDGILGAALSVAMALHAAQTYLKLWRLQRTGEK
jgi:glycosyltransferase involved in cell wall biosynthesis